ncbi:MAG TPA: PQQ-binding-like beta-propeller repeat protein [Acidobacteriota bacterium]|nr:PQQ-binding-like beta-propeller repeat protein [Acidobacteriota bacterium]
MALKTLILLIYAPYFTSGKSEFACLDAYTGRLIWKLSVAAFPPRESVAVAYGTLHLTPGYVKEQEMDYYVTIDQVWAIGTKPWPMWRRAPEHTGTGQFGPTNLTLRWEFTTCGAVLSSPSVVDGRVYVGSNDKNIYCLDALSGRLVWNFTRAHYAKRLNNRLHVFAEG